MAVVKRRKRPSPVPRKAPRATPKAAGRATRKAAGRATRKAAAPGPKMMVVPATMKAAAIDRFGPPETLQVRTVPTPRVDANEVLIALHAAGVGSWDAQIRAGTWAEGDEKFPLILGTDGAGTVAAVGARVRRFSLGQRVWAYSYENPKGGFYAEYVAVGAEDTDSCPPSLDLLHAGAAAVTALTAQQGIDDHLAVRRGETVLVFGATGAVGTLAIQFAKRKRARVIATASGRAAAELVRSLGADGSFDGHDPKALRKLPELAPDGIDAVLALAGGEVLDHCIHHVNRGGRVAYPNGVEPEPRAPRGIKVHAYDAASGRREWERLARAVTEARLQVPIAATYPLAQAARAHARIEKGGVLGRIVLRIR